MSNKVVVQPGGKTFTTIQAAIDSITDASEKLWYSVLCSPGRYNEVVKLKPWVFVIGMDESADSTIITANACQGSTVTAASNSGITACTIISVSTSDFGSPCAVKSEYAENFQLTGCKVYTKDGPGAHSGAICTVSVNFLSGYSKSSMTISSCEIHQECVSPQGGPSMEAVACGADATLEVYNSTITCIDNPGDYACALLADPGTVAATISNISCPQMALDLGENGGALKAINCEISGKIGKGVIVVND